MLDNRLTRVVSSLKTSWHSVWLLWRVGLWDFWKIPNSSEWLWTLVGSAKEFIWKTYFEEWRQTEGLDFFSSLWFTRCEQAVDLLEKVGARIFNGKRIKVACAWLSGSYSPCCTWWISLCTLSLNNMDTTTGYVHHVYQHLSIHISLHVSAHSFIHAIP